MHRKQGIKNPPPRLLIGCPRIKPKPLFEALNRLSSSVESPLSVEFSIHLTVSHRVSVFLPDGTWSPRSDSEDSADSGDSAEADEERRGPLSQPGSSQPATCTKLAWNLSHQVIGSKVWCCFSSLDCSGDKGQNPLTQVGLGKS